MAATFAQRAQMAARRTAPTRTFAKNACSQRFWTDYAFRRRFSGKRQEHRCHWPPHPPAQQGFNWCSKRLDVLIPTVACTTYYLAAAIPRDLHFLCMHLAYVFVNRGCTAKAEVSASLQLDGAGMHRGAGLASCGETYATRLSFVQHAALLLCTPSSRIHISRKMAAESAFLEPLGRHGPDPLPKHARLRSSLNSIHSRQSSELLLFLVRSVLRKPAVRSSARSTNTHAIRRRLVLRPPCSEMFMAHSTHRAYGFLFRNLRFFRCLAAPGRLRFQLVRRSGLTLPTL